MRNAIKSQPVYPVKDYEKDLAEMKLAKSTPRPEMDEPEGVPWAIAFVLLVGLIQMFFLIGMGFIYALKWAGWV